MLIQHSTGEPPLSPHFAFYVETRSHCKCQCLLTRVSGYGRWKLKPGQVGGVLAKLRQRQVYFKQSDFFIHVRTEYNVVAMIQHQLPARQSTQD